MEGTANPRKGCAALVLDHYPSAGLRQLGSGRRGCQCQHTRHPRGCPGAQPRPGSASCSRPEVVTPAGPDREQRVRRTVQRQRLRLADMAAVAAAAVIAVAIPAGLGAFGQPPRLERPPAAPTLYVYASNVGSGANRA